MFKRGLIKEAKSLMKIGQRKHLTSTQALGYKEVIAHLSGEIPLEEAKELIKQRTRRFAKRQLTWFRGDPRIHWLDLSGKTYLQVAKEIVKLLELNRFIDMDENGTKDQIR
jgi:tRNA dimethylallyltransferase